MNQAETNNFLVALIDKLTPLNNEWRLTNDAIRKIEIMWSIGKEIDNAIKISNFGFDQLLRTIYDPHGKKMSYITRDLLSYSHRVYTFFPSTDVIKEKLKGLTSYTLFREAFPLITNEKYKLSDDDKQAIISLITNPKSSPKTVQSKLKKMKQDIRPIKNTRNTKSDQYNLESEWLAGLREEIIAYYKNNDELDIRSFPLTTEDAEVLKTIILAIAFDKLPEGINTAIIDNSNIKQLSIIASAKTEDKARFKKWGFDTYALMTLAEMINVLSDTNKYYFVRQKILTKAK